MSSQHFQKSSLFGECFWKDTLSVNIFTKYMYLLTVGQTGEKNLHFKQKPIRLDEAWVYKLWPLINMQGVH